MTHSNEITSVMRQALEALDNAQHFIDEYAAAKYIHAHNAAITSLRQAIAEAEKQEQGEPVAWQSVSTEMLKFLNGEAPLDGVWFGEDHPIEKGAYWWRKRLNTTPQPKQEQRSVSEHLGEPVAITITGKLGNIYSFTGDYSLKKGDNVYTTPYVLCSCGTAEGRQQRIAEREPLTDEQIRKASLEAGMQEHYMGFHSGFIRLARAIEAAHGITGETK